MPPPQAVISLNRASRPLFGCRHLVGCVRDVFHDEGNVMRNRIRCHCAGDSSSRKCELADLFDFVAVMQRIHDEAEGLTEEDHRMMRRLEFWTVCAIGASSKKP